MKEDLTIDKIIIYLFTNILRLISTSLGKTLLFKNFIAISDVN